MAKRKYTYGKGSSEWEKPGDYYVDGKWMCYYTDTGSGQSGKFTVKKALRLSDEFKDNPDEVIRVMIAGDQAKRRRDAEAGEGPESKKGKRTAATEALTVAAAAGHMAESVKRAPAPVTPMNLSEGRNRDYDAERRSADERKEHRRMAGSFGNIQKIVDEEMDEDGSDMCHILKLVAMAIFSQRGGSELGPSSPEEKLRLVADLVSSELQGMLKQHKAASVGGAAGKQLPGMAGGGGRRRRTTTWSKRRGSRSSGEGASYKVQWLCRGRAYRDSGGEMGGGGETQIAAGERRAKGLALRGKVRSSGRFGKTHQQRCTSMYTDQCNTTAAIPRKLQL